MPALTIKICGITRVEDALLAAELGVDLLGLIFAQESKRRLDTATAQQIVDAVAGKCKTVGVFQNQPLELVERLREQIKFDIVQFHGNEAVSAVASIRPNIKALSASTHRYDASADMLLLDSSHMSTTTDLYNDDTLTQPYLVAGGLTVDNVSDAIHTHRSNRFFRGVDVASGIEESPGCKSHNLMRQFVLTAREAYSNAVAR